MDIVLQQQLPRHEFGNTPGLGADPYQALVGQETMYKVASQRQGTGSIPDGKAIGLVVIDIHTGKRAHQQGVVGCQGKTGEKLM